VAAKMKFASHQTFYIREGWLAKGLRVIKKQNDIFLRKDAIEELGIGRNMVTALRYWLQATGLTEEVSENRRRVQRLTKDFGEIISKSDPYFEDKTTLWLLHYNLAKNEDLATTWFWFFNKFNYREFDENIFLSQLKNWVKEEGVKVADSSLKRDFDCLINSYLVPSKETVANPEDNLLCPFRELGLIEYSDEKRRTFRLTRRDIDEMPLEVFHYCILDFVGSGKTFDKEHATIDELLNEETSIGRIFSLGLGELILVLERLQEQGLIHITKTAGLNNVTIIADDTPESIIKLYYEKKQGIAV
jgi:hypothetical protein